MTAQEMILWLLAGGILGMLGQGMRVIVGLKKVFDQATESTNNFASQFNWSRLLFSMLIGAVAGALAILALSTDPATMKLSKENLLTLIASGYAGTDFIEGFVKKHLPSNGATANANAANAAHDEQPAMG